MTVRISADLESLTWGELFYLTDCARRAGYTNSTAVETEIDEQHEDAVVSLYLDVDPATVTGARAPVLVPADDVSEYVDNLQAIVDDDGDARRYIADLRALIQLLRGESDG